ncbi:Uncharacterized conserved protein [Faunimonas pinastri]|uniref:Uncharacterized conserved protein n=1 Tax=Faunimonas pinastri TaxID=1855383 RepID=A0A1H9GQF1_9HYPH|nr:esterase-like activity of phytase family protein [Faunimonas pinastri]SEQ52254.1 Uncharacterized conserved protein [Faunimonas pinastri]
MKKSSRLAVLALTCSISAPAVAADLQVLKADDPTQDWKVVEYPGGKQATYTVGIGSAAFRAPGDPADMIWTMSDRGPNFTCDDARDIMGEASQAMCKGIKNSRFYPTPDYTPSIYHVQLDRQAGTFAVKDVIAIKTRSGKPVSGLINPQTAAITDQPIDLKGNKLPLDPDAVDSEGLVRLSDGTFWISEEMGPSIIHLTADGRMVKRFVPADAAGDYAKTDAEISATLPAILSKRQPNRGTEALAVSPDGKFLYFMVQNPLANPDADVYKKARNTRIFKMDRATETLVGEYVYQLDDPMSFEADPSRKQNNPRVSEMSALGPDRLLVLERTDKDTKLHEIALDGATNILATPWDDLATSPSLEQRNDLSGTDVKPVTKTLRYDSFKDGKGVPDKTEGVAFLGDGSMALINDNDFGITGEVTRIAIVKGLVTPDPDVYSGK